eukprot:gene25196-33722_t
MAHFRRLSVPSFDLTWIEINNSFYVLVPGGGGSLKSGVKNQIQVGRANSKTNNTKLDIDFLDGFKTDSPEKSRLCSGICVGILLGIKVVCTLLESTCLVLALEADGATGLAKFSRKVEFSAVPECSPPADGEESNDGLNCCAIVADPMQSDRVVTGGDDHMIRVWGLSSPSDSDGEWEAIPLSVLAGHSGPVMSLALGAQGWISSASKDGSCRLWEIGQGEVGVVDSLNTQLTAVGSSATNANKVEDRQCRGCCFSEDGSHLFSIQSGKKGNTSLVKWRLQASEVRVTASVVKVVVACSVPSTRLKINDTGEFIAVGASDGAVILFRSKDLAKMWRLECHDMPVTGLCFVPTALAKRRGYPAIVTSCSVDKKMATLTAGGFSFLFAGTVTLLLLIAIAVLGFMTAALLNHFGFAVINR